MGLRINTNVVSLAAQANLQETSQRLQGVMFQLASGSRIPTASHDPAGLGASEQLRARIRSWNEFSRGIDEGRGLLATAEGVLEETSGILTRARELVVQASSETLEASDLEVLQSEFAGLVAELGRQLESSSYRDVDLFTTTQTLSLGTVEIDLVDMSGIAATLSPIDLSTSSGRALAPSLLEAASDAVIDLRAQMGARYTRFASMQRSAGVSVAALSKSEARIRDLDYAQATAELSRISILQQGGVAVLAQANAQPSLTLQLLDAL